jgi:uncharacterized membrane protein HdeD (DUF308 family)
MSEQEKESARFAITLRMPGFLMIHAGVIAVPLALQQHRWQSFVACVLLSTVGACGAGMVKGRPVFVWLAVALWFISSGFSAIWLWDTEFAWLVVFPGLMVPLDMVVDLLPATRTLGSVAQTDSPSQLDRE